MSLSVSKKTPRNGHPTLNDDKKKRSPEDKNILKRNIEKSLQKEEENKKKTIDWEEEKDIIKKFLSQEYPLSSQKIDKIIEERATKYIDMDKYKTFFLRHQSKVLTNNIKKSRKLSNAPDSVRSLFDDEAKEVNYSSSSDEDENNEEVEGYESDKSVLEMEEDEDATQNVRLRKCQSSTLDDNPKKKDTPVLRWLPDGNNVRNSSILSLLLSW